MREHRGAERVLAWILAIVIAQPAAFGVTAGPSLPDPGTVSLSREQQQQLGLKAMGEVYQQMPVLPDSSPLSQYVQQLGKKLEQVIPQEHSWPYQFHVVQQKEINAFALPGGPVFVNVGTITAADNEAELAGVMAHEMSHVYMQHSVKEMQKAGMTQGIAGIVGGILGTVLGGTAGALANMGAQYAGGMLSLKYSREEEAQADAVGAIIMYKAGYNPRAMAEFFQKLEKEGGAGPQFLSDHPNPGNRVAAVDKEIQDWPAKTYLGSSQAFVNAKQDAGGVKVYSGQQIADGAKSGEWAQQNRQSGAVPKEVALPASGVETAGGGSLTNLRYEQIKPATSFAELQRSGIRIAHPDNWQISASQDSGSILIAPSAAVSANSIAYGVMISGSQNSGSLDQATQNLIQGMQQSNPGMRQQGNIQTIPVGGTQGLSVTLISDSPVKENGKPLTEQDWLVTLPDRQGGLLYLVFISPDRDFGQLRPTFQRMLDSLHVE